VEAGEKWPRPYVEMHHLPSFPLKWLAIGLGAAYAYGVQEQATQP